ncbi:XVIPCD domain-containing protein [Pseudomonas sp. CGJS7]|uniref:XVIPCD domain-containing protein n=1 Tax=Pseudomonas sp. CGJS7 TaxID=3109348 RepID=UPI00300BA2E2
MATLTPEAQAVVDAFASSGVTPDQAANLRSLIANSPTLVDQLNRATAPPDPSIASIGMMADDSLSGEYDQDLKQVRLGKSQLDAPASGSFNAIGAAFTLSHEIQHGLNQRELTTANDAFLAEAERIAQTPGPTHDYTAATEALLKANRRNEATAEIAGYNAAVETLAATHPNPTLGDIYESDPGNMGPYIEKSAAPPFTYSAKSGLTFNADGTLTANELNIDAVGDHFFDIPRGAPAGLGQNHDEGYPNFYGAYAVNVIAYYERQHNPPQPGVVAPQPVLDLKHLGLSEAGMESVGVDLGDDKRPMPYLDSSTNPPTAGSFDHTLGAPAPTLPPPGPTPPTTPPPGPSPPNAAGSAADASLRADHPDYPLYQQIRAGVERIDTEHGRGYDDASERLTRAALARVKENGGGPVDHVVLSQDRSTLFLVKGGLDDPAQQRTALAVGEALQTPVAESQRRADAVPQAQEAAQVQRPEARAVQH